MRNMLNWNTLPYNIVRVKKTIENIGSNNEKKSEVITENGGW